MEAENKTVKAINACHRCGATSYHPELARAADGGMRPTGRYRCVRCHVLFTTVAQWRLGPACELFLEGRV